MKILVLGGGAQGSACALDLVSREDVEQVVLADVSVDSVASFLQPFLGGKLVTRPVDANDHGQIRAALDGMDVVACALPYYFNLPVTRLAIEAGVHFCDLGGNTEIVKEQLALSDEARASGSAVVPDCGLAPGMVNVLAQGGIDAMDEVDSVRIFVGGLPEQPEPPLNYRIAYSMDGVLDYYTTPVLALEEGRVVEKEALTGVETVTFPEPIGELEAFLTAGGISTMPYRHQGSIRSMTYKTLRYPGHAALMKAIRDLGLLGTDPIDIDGCAVSPRDVFMRVVSPHLTRGEGGDLVALRVVVSGTADGVHKVVEYEMIDRDDPERGVTSMMRTTGYSLAAISRLLASGNVEAGVRPPADCVPVDWYVGELAELGVRIERSVS